MKFRISLKDPDGFSEGYNRAVKKQMQLKNLDQEEQEALQDLYEDRILEATQQWVEYGEYITIEFDTTDGTARVVPKGE